MADIVMNPEPDVDMGPSKSRGRICRDPELGAILDIQDILADLPLPAQRRSLDYLRSRVPPGPYYATEGTP